MRLFIAIIVTASQIIGVQCEIGTAASNAAIIRPGGWVKYRASLVDSPEQIRADLAQLAGHPLLLTIHNSPEAGRAYPCSPIRDYETWVQSALALIDQYHPAMIELWNEPDGGHSFPQFFGCDWPMQDYIRFATYACQRIKSVYPDIITLVGALSDYRNAALIPPGTCDRVSVHYYAIKGRNYSADLIAIAAIPGVWVTETSLLDDPDGLQQAQYARDVLDLGVPVFFYTLGGNGWRYSDLRGRPAYCVYNPIFAGC